MNIKHVTAIAAFGLSILLTSLGVRAAENIRDEKPECLDVFTDSVGTAERNRSASLSYSGADGEARLSELNADYDVLYAKLRSAAMQHSEYVLFTQDDFSITDFSQVSEVFNTLSQMGYDDPEMFFFDGAGARSTIRSYDLSHWAAYYYIDYAMSAEDVEEALNECRLAASSLLANVREDMSELEKVLLIHDNIALNYTYDESYEKYDMYSIISTGEGVCQAYAMLYRHLLGLVGIESEYVKSPAINHEWLRIRIDGEWYHSDVTWDDPTASSVAQGSEIPGLVKHCFFLGSDEFFTSFVSDNGSVHMDFETGFCTSDRFDTAVWISSDVPVVFDDAFFYCFGNNASGIGNVLFRASKDDPSEASAAVIGSVSDKWYIAPNGGYYPKAFPGLAMVNGLLVFSDFDGLYVCTADGSHRTALLPDAASELSEYGAVFRFGAWADGYRYGVVPGIRGETSITYYRSKDANDPGTNVLPLTFGLLPGDLHTLTEAVSSAPGYLRWGKMTAVCGECGYTEYEGIVPLCGKETPDISDLTALLRYLAGVCNNSFNAACADEDKNGVTTLADLNRILRGVAEDTAEAIADTCE